MSGAPLNCVPWPLGARRAAISGDKPHVAIGARLRRTPPWLMRAMRRVMRKNLQSSGAYGRDRLITMPWGVDVAQRGTHHVVESCKDRYFPIASIMPMCFTDFASHDQ